jgi:hypothetical protein
MLGSRVTSVGVVNELRAGLERSQGLDPWQRQNILFIVSGASRPTLGLTQLLIQ